VASGHTAHFRDGDDSPLIRFQMKMRQRGLRCLQAVNFEEAPVR
jgi:hypothetical protein